MFIIKTSRRWAQNFHLIKLQFQASFLKIPINTAILSIYFSLKISNQ